MNNKRYDIYKDIFLALINILTQNHIYNLDFETITTDVELALIKAVNAAFPMVRHFNCYFHYKQDLIRKFKKEGLYKRKSKKEEINECQIILNELGLLHLQYKGDINLINNKLNQLIQNYPRFEHIIENYFKVHKLSYFINGDYNYNDLPIDCRSKSYLENYKLYMKQNLGRKYKLR